MFTQLRADFRSALISDARLTRTNRTLYHITMPKLLLGILFVLATTAGCDTGPKVADPTLEKTPWLFPGPNIEQLTAADFKARAVAARSLGRMGAKAEAAIPELEKLLKDKHPEVREVAAEALKKIRAATGESGH